MSSAPDPLTAALSDRYRIERELGVGGMATVYLAEDVKHHRQVAVKVLREDLTASLGKERFLREINIAAGLTHPHILPLHDSGEAAGRLFYVMPYADGPSLRQKLLRGGELPIADAVRILRDVADAMAYAHKRGVVHRDLKPENVMLTERHALVTDFGVAKALSDATGRQSMTTAGVALGTPAYMSPEQATADPHADHRSDIYSFGVLAYELLTGRTPFGGGSPQEVLAAHVTTVAQPVGIHRASIPPALAALVMKCLEKKPADRFQSAEELIPQLEALLTPSGGITPHETAPYNGAAARGKGRWKAVAIAGMLVVVAVAAVLFRSRGAATDRAAAPSSDTAKPIWLAVLPPENKGRPEDEWFGDGLADEIRGALVKIPGAQVKGSRSSQTFKGTTKTIPEIARALGVDYLVVSTVRWDPTAGAAGTGRVRIAPELVDARTETVKWRSSYDTTLTDLFSGQVALAQRAARDLAGALHLSPGATAASGTTPAPPTVRPDAYAAYLAGRQEFNRITIDSRGHAIDLLSRAVRLDTTFAKAHAWLAFALFYWDGWKKDSVAMRTALRKAMALAPNDPDVLMAHGLIRELDGDWKGAQADFSRVLALDHGDVWTIYFLMEIETALGHADRGVELGKRAVEIDPVFGADVYPIALRRAGRLDDALAAARAGLIDDSLSTSNAWWGEVSYALAYQGDVAGYRAANARQIALRGGQPRLRDAEALARAGRVQEARAALAQMRPAAVRGDVSRVFIAGTFASLGEADSAIAWLNRVVTLDEIHVPTDAFFEPIRSDARYVALLKRWGLR